MAYNKTKIAEAAQKFLNQGKIREAIAQYQQILKHEPKDQVTLMTLGDLYVRLGETFQALEYFERLAHLFLSDGFVTKAIAIYKKIAKLAPEETKPLEKLAELYVQQGVMSEARPIYLQLAEVHLKANRQPQAVGLLRKLLEAEPDNMRVQSRLADLYHAMGQDKEATETHLASAQRLFERREFAEVERVIDRALKIEPNYPPALALKAKALAAAGKRSEAITLLEGLPDLDSGSDVTTLLVEQYLQASEADRAVALARKVFQKDQKKIDHAYTVVSALTEAGQPEKTLELLNLIRGPMIEVGDHDRLAQVLTGAATRLQGRLEPLEWLVDLYGRTSDSFHLPDALGQLGEAALAAGQLERAKEAYEQLCDRNPEDDTARRRLNQVRAKMGLETAEAAQGATSAVKVESQPAVYAQTPALVIPEPPLDEETQVFVSQALTDVDLFSSYGLTQKALDLLETVLQRAPRHTATIEKLLDMYLGAGDDRRTAELAAQLEQIYTQRGDTAHAERFAELRRRFQRVAGMADEEMKAAAEAAQKPPEFTIPMVEAQAVPVIESQPIDEPLPVGESAVHEVDLSEEWAALSDEVEAFDAKASAMLSEEVPAEAQLLPVAHEEVIESAAADATQPAAEAPAEAPEADYELAPAVNGSAAAETVQATPPSDDAVMSSEDFLSQLAEEFGGTLPEAEAHAAPQASAPAARQAGETVSTGALGEVFDEFRAELGEMGVDEEDLETHYNLGIAYREMGLLEEAIGEFQKVAKASDQGRTFRYYMQCCTLLGLAFMEKGQPSIAAMWYERALQTQGLDPESILALRYDLGIAQELSGDEAAALKSFSQVYGMNIDYRDVAERIAALGPRR